MLINGDFDTPLLNGALFHQSTFRDLFGLRGLSFTAGLRLDYEKMKMNYNSGTAMDYTVGIKGEMVRGGQIIKEIPMMPETSLTVQSRYQAPSTKTTCNCCLSSPSNMISKTIWAMSTQP